MVLATLDETQLDLLEKIARVQQPTKPASRALLRKGLTKPDFDRAINGISASLLEIHKFGDEMVYRVTLRGLLEGRTGPEAREIGKRVLARLKVRYDQNPEFDDYTWEELKAICPEWTDAQFQLVFLVIDLARLSGGGSSSHETPMAQWRRPSRIEDIVECDTLDALIEMREQEGIEEKTAQSKEPPVPEYSVNSLKVFVSHSSADRDAAAAFAGLLRDALRLSARDIRCTSVSEYKLPAGANADDHLRREVFECVAFVALLSRASLNSAYVMFELGARWGAGRPMVPLRIGGLGVEVLEAPLSAMQSVDGASEIEIHSLIKTLGEWIGVEPEGPESYLRALKIFVAYGRRNQRSVGKMVFDEEEELKKLSELLSERDEDEEDRHVTEVIRIDELE